MTVPQDSETLTVPVVESEEVIFSLFGGVNDLYLPGPKSLLSKILGEETFVEKGIIVVILLITQKDGEITEPVGMYWSGRYIFWFGRELSYAECMRGSFSPVHIVSSGLYTLYR